MKEEKKKEYSELRAVIQICNDGIDGYEKAADTSEHINLRRLFMKIAQDRKTYSTILQKEARLLYGEEVNDTDSIKGELHQTWMNVKATFSGNTDKAILEECLRGETEAVKVYKEIIESNILPSSIIKMLETQLENIEDSKRKMEVMADVIDREESEAFKAPNQKGEPRKRVVSH